MGIMDKISGRAKKAAGEVTDDATLRRQGQKEDAKGEAKERQASAEEHAEQEKQRADELDRQT